MLVAMPICSLNMISRMALLKKKADDLRASADESGRKADIAERTLESLREGTAGSPLSSRPALLAELSSKLREQEQQLLLAAVKAEAAAKAQWNAGPSHVADAASGGSLRERRSVEAARRVELTSLVCEHAQVGACLPILR